MKNSVKKTIATLILLVFATINIWADGEMQCPVTDSTPPVTPEATQTVNNDDSQEIDGLGNLISTLLNSISNLF